MNEKNLLKVALICSIIGILIILFLSERIRSSYLDINNVSYSLIDQDVRVKGRISSFRDLPSTFLINLKDDTGMITVIAFKKENVTLKEGNIVEVYGAVTEYKNQLELEAKQIRLFS